MNEKILKFTYLKISIYALTFSLCMLSLYFANYNPDLGLSFLVLSFTIFTISIIKTIKRSGLLSTLSIFVIYSSIAYPIMMFYYFINPSKIFFANMPIRFEYPNYEDFYFTFLYFLIGYCSFIIGFTGMKAKPEKIICSQNNPGKTLLPNLKVLMLISLVLLLVDYFLRFKYHIGLLFGDVYGYAPKIGYKIKGIIYFLFIHSKIFLFPIYLYVSIKRRQPIHSLIALSLLLIVAIFDTISLSKGGFIYFLFICTVIYLLLGDNRKIIPQPVLIIIGFVALFLAIIIFPIINFYRNMAIAEGIIGIDAIPIALQNINYLLSNIDIKSSLIDFLSRIFMGFDQLYPVIAYGRQHDLLNWSDLLVYLAGDNTKGYHFFYFTKITGFGEELLGKTQHAGNIWGLFYFYFGFIGIFIGMFLWGKFNRWCYEKIRSICGHYDAFGVPLVAVYLLWFVSIIQNADLFGYGIRFFIGNIMLFIIWRELLGFLSKLYIGKRSPKGY